MVELMAKAGANAWNSDELTRAIDELTKTLADQDSAADDRIAKSESNN